MLTYSREYEWTLGDRTLIGTFANCTHIIVSLVKDVTVVGIECDNAAVSVISSNCSFKK